MALVLRKAVLPKNVSLIKCIKGRSLATSNANKKNPATLTTAVPHRRLNETKCQPLTPVKIEKSKQLAAPRGCGGITKNVSIRCCTSCPNLSSETKKRNCLPLKHHSPTRTRPVSHGASNAYSVLAIPHCSVPASKAHNTTDMTSKRTYASCKCGCPCPLPCGPCGCGCGCGCLPPPCNIPPRCVQFMTGYYYYPYGYWFCGPYHVSGTCCPVGCGCGCGPCGPCGPSCGPCGPCAPKCPPCCVCPATVGGIVSSTGNLKDISTKSILINKLPCPNSKQESIKANRSGISKFFPFSSATAIAPNCDIVPKLNPSKPTLPESSSVTSVRHYSTRCGAPESNFKQHVNSQFPQSTPEYGFSRTLLCRQRGPEDACPSLEQPRALPTREERDMPSVRPGAFSYSSIPNYKSPYPQPFTNLKSYEP